MLYHWDLPQALQDLGGWTNAQLAELFADYARVAFDHFGDRVKYWVTMNEPCHGYDGEDFAPGINASGIADYMCYRVGALAHANVYRLYDKTYRRRQKGKIGITVSAPWFEPATPRDREAAERMRDFFVSRTRNQQRTLIPPLSQVGRYLGPLAVGDFPAAMRERVAFRSAMEGYSRSRLPSFTPEEAEHARDTLDFVGVNYYSTFLVADGEEAPFDVTSIASDVRVRTSRDPWCLGASGSR